MKDFIKNEKVREAIGFFACIIIILVIARVSGFIGGFGAKDFQLAYYNVAKNFSNIKPPEIINTNSQSGGGSNTNAKVNGYQPLKIPDAVLRGSKTTRNMEYMFSGNKKNVYYVFGTANLSNEFHTNIQNKTSSLSSKYNFYSSKTTSIGTGNTGSNKICNSIQECNDVRQKASDHTVLSNFFFNCGKTMCIINPYRKQYVILKKRDINEATKMLNALKNW